MRALTVLTLVALSTTLVAQEDPFPVSRPAKPMTKTTVKATPKAEPKAEDPQDEPVTAPNLDKHYLQKDEYLVTPDGYKAGSGWAGVYIAKMVTPPTADTKHEGEFFILNGDKKGEKIWTKHYALTRPAGKEDMKLGAVLYALDGNVEDDIYMGPKNREDNLNHRWFVGTLNDDSNLYKGYLSLAGYKVKPGALRVAVKR